MFSHCRMLVQRLGRRRVIVPGLLLLLLVCVGGWPLGRQIEAAYHFRAARRALQQRDFSAAESHLRAYLAVWPDDETAHFLAARCARCQEQYQEAQQHLARCRHVEDAKIEAALLCVQRGQLGENENYLKRTISPHHPDAPLVLEALALGYSKTDRLVGLLECTDLWLQIRPEDPQALYWRGYAWERLRRRDKAWECYQRAVAADPFHHKASLRLANLLLQRFRRPAEALEQLEKIRPQYRDDPEVILALARCYRLLDRLDEAQKLVEELLARHPQLAEALAERGRLARTRGQIAEAENYFRRATTAAPDDREALYDLLQCLEQRGQNEEARLCADRLRQLETDLAHLEELIAQIGRRPDDAYLRCQAGLLCLRYGKDREGLHWLTSALQMSPHHSATHAALADYYQRQGQSEQASFHRHLAAQPQQRER
jgi:tetratricopeptide (TPR) repeat protein